jgi:hypothetical protein
VHSLNKLSYLRYLASSTLQPAHDLPILKDLQLTVSSDVPVSERIEMAIQRYKGRRKFHAAHSNSFSSWLKWGGIEHGPKMFTGALGEDELADMEADEIARVNATYHAGWEKMDPEMWVVDFEGIAKSFL